MQTVALFGPTGVGKTAVAVALADLLRARGEDPVAVSADALQVYMGLEVLTGVASAEQRAALEHRLISFLPVDATFSVGQYAQLAHAEIDALLAAGRTPIVVGGTGLYLRAALTELNLRPPPPEGLRERWREALAQRGPAALHALLASRAPWAAATIDPADGQRLVRALELFDLGELTPAEGDSELWSADVRHPTLLAGLTMEREAHYRAIDARVDEMIARLRFVHIHDARAGTLQVIVRNTGVVLGTARCRRLQVEDGGQITGRIEMLSEAKSRPVEAAPRVAAEA